VQSNSLIQIKGNMTFEANGQELPSKLDLTIEQNNRELPKGGNRPSLPRILQPLPSQ
jgi:hypothetical protein